MFRAVERAAESDGTNGDMERQVGLPVVRAVAAFGRGDYADCTGLLMPIRYRAHAWGGSHAQRDIIHRTLIEAALRGGDKAPWQAPSPLSAWPSNPIAPTAMRSAPAPMPRGVYVF